VKLEVQRVAIKNVQNFESLVNESSKVAETITHKLRVMITIIA
jgi:hypothetical protein